MRQPLPFGKYLLLERISVGGMAEVFKAKVFGVEGFEKLVAIKRILPSMAEDADFVQMFIDEAKICGQLNHANICQTFELGRIEDSHFIAMEYIWGKDLLQIQNRFRRLRKMMPPQMAAFIASKVCEGLDYAHRKKDATGRPLGIIHRDVSPQNILVSYDGDIKVIDFGIAKAATRASKTQAGVLKGKFGYMSPEHVRGMELDRRSDIFSIGTILYELLTNERLFLGESDFATLEKIRNVDIPPPSKINPEIPPELDRIILKALSREVEQRYQWASEMQEDLLNYLMAEEPVFNTKALATWMREQFAAEMRREAQILEEQRTIGREWMNQPAPGRAAPPSVRLRPATSALPAAPRLAEEPGLPLAARDGPEDDDLAGEKTAIAAPADMPAESTHILPAPEGPGEGDGASTKSPVIDQPGDLAVSATVVMQQDQVERAPSGPAPGPEPRPQTPPAAQSYYPPPQVPPYVSPMASYHGHPAFPGNPPPPASLTGGFYLPPPSRATPVRPPPADKNKTLWKDVLVGVGVALMVIAGALVVRSVAGAPRGTIILTVLPSQAADVLVDDRAAGRIDLGGSLLLRDVPRGSHVVRARSDDAEGQQVLEVVSSEPVQATIRMAPRQAAAAGQGTLRLRLPPDGALVVVDGKSVSEQELQHGYPVAAGVPHEVRVTKAGKREQVFRFTVAPGQVEERQVDLSDARGTITVTSDPPGADISIEGQARGKTPQTFSGMDIDRQIRVVLRRRGYGTATRYVLLGDKNGYQQELNVHLSQEGQPAAEEHPAAPSPAPQAQQPPMEGTGYLVANTKPYAKVFIDGQDTGRTTPIAPRDRIPLRAGRHTVTFVTTNQKKYRFEVVVRPGEEKKLTQDLTE